MHGLVCTDKRIKNKKGKMQEEQNAALKKFITTTGSASGSRANRQVEHWVNGLHLTEALKVNRRDEERCKEAK